MDLEPGFSPHAYVSHDISLNVAYWNLQQRRLGYHDEGWTANGQRLTFFHYSGFDPRIPARLSKWDPALDNAMPEPLRRLTSDYAERLLANGYGTVPDASYAYARFTSGTVIHPLVRHMFREWHRYWPDDPYDTYEAFLSEPWPGAARWPGRRIVTNFMKFLHDNISHLSRSDLSRPSHVKKLADWFFLQAETELMLDPALVKSVAVPAGLHQREPLPVPRQQIAAAQVTVVGYLRTASGVGEVGRETLLALAAGGVQVEGYDVALNVTAKRDDESCVTLLRETGTAPI